MTIPLRTPITLVSKIPPSLEVFVEEQMEGPSMFVVHHTANRARVKINSYLPPENDNPHLMMAFGIPFIMDEPMRALREAFMSMMTRIPEYDYYPLFSMFNMSIKILIWNVQGVGNKLDIIGELVRINKPTVMALIETHLSGENAQKIVAKWLFGPINKSGGSGSFWRNLVVLEGERSVDDHIWYSYASPLKSKS